MTPEPGIYPGVPFDEYVAWDAVNNSFLWTMKTKNAAYAKYEQEHPKQTKALKYGEILHALALEPDTFRQRYLAAPKCLKNTNVGNDIYEHWKKGLNGRKEFDCADYAKMLKLDKALRSKRIHKFIEQGEAEVCILWIDKKTGLLCKGRLDYLLRKHAVIIDLKSTIYPFKERFEKEIWNLGYYQKAAFYCDGYTEMTATPPAFTFLIYDKNPPHDSVARELSAKSIIAGRISYREQLKKYKEYKESDYWPGFPNEIEVTSLPEWALNRAGVNKYNLSNLEDEEYE